jgi:hypothetical protein
MRAKIKKERPISMEVKKAVNVTLSLAAEKFQS